MILNLSLSIIQESSTAKDNENSSSAQISKVRIKQKHESDGILQGKLCNILIYLVSNMKDGWLFLKKKCLIDHDFNNSKVW